MAKNLILSILSFLFFINFCYAEKIKHAGELGYCVLCETIILDKIGFHIKPNEEYNETWFIFSNGSRGKIALCDKHYKVIKRYKPDRIPKGILTKIMDGIKRGWEREFAINNWNDTQIEKYKQGFFSLTITRRLTDEEVRNIK